MIARLFRENLGLKLMSLGLAFVLWQYFASRTPDTRFILVSLDVVAPEGLSVVEFSPKEVRVRIQGEPALMSRVDDKGVYVRVPIDPDTRPGRNIRIVAQDSHVQGLPNGVMREVVDPTVTATIERRLSRMVPVRIKVEGVPAVGYRVLASTADPPQVEISGPEEVLARVAHIATTPIDTSDQRRSFEATVKLARPDPLIVARPDAVRAKVAIDEIPMPLAFELPVRPSSEGYAADPATVRVRLEGPPTLVARVGNELNVIADTDGVPLRGGMASVRLDFGAIDADEQSRIRVLLIDPARVRLRRVP